MWCDAGCTFTSGGLPPRLVPSLGGCSSLSSLTTLCLILFGHFGPTLQSWEADKAMLADAGTTVDTVSQRWRKRANVRSLAPAIGRFGSDGCSAWTFPGSAMVSAASRTDP